MIADAFEEKDAGRVVYSAQEHLGRVRWGANGDGTRRRPSFKINSVWSAWYSRVIQMEEPSLIGFYRLRDSLADELIWKGQSWVSLSPQLMPTSWSTRSMRTCQTRIGSTTAMSSSLQWSTGLREVFVKDPTGHRVGYFDDLHKALDVLGRDENYRAAWFSLNICPGVPSNFELNRLYRASGRYKKSDYRGRQLLLVDCDPKRKADTSSTEAQKAAALSQVRTIREFLRNLGFPDPILADSGNGYHLLYAIAEPNDEGTETLIRNFLAGLAAKFSNDESHVDAGNFEANRITKLYGTVARKGDDPTLWRRSALLEVPTYETELPAKSGRARETVTDIALEPVPRSLLESALSELPVPRNTALGSLSENDIIKTDWLRKLCEIGDVAILWERRQGKFFVFDIICPRAASHGSTTSDSATIVSYNRITGYGFHCLHASLQGKAESYAYPLLQRFSSGGRS